MVRSNRRTRVRHRVRNNRSNKSRLSLRTKRRNRNRRNSRRIRRRNYKGGSPATRHFQELELFSGRNELQNGPPLTYYKMDGVQNQYKTSN